MVIATLTSVMVAIAGLYIFYGIVIRVAPDLLFPLNDQWLPRGVEWLVILAMCIVAAGISAAMATRLARRVVKPLVSVAQSARSIVARDLTARADAGEGATLEATMLVEDFNHLAEELERASEALPRWNATIAHELRTPVTILSGRLQGLADGVFKPDETLFRSLVAQVDALARLIEDLRTVSLLEGGRMEMQFQSVELSGEIEAVIRLMQPVLESAGFTISAVLAKGYCDIDPARIRQALLALLDNARRHANPAQIDVVLQTEKTRVRLSVADQGPGLGADFAKHAFEPFRRYMEQGSSAKGSGLGLSVVRVIAKAHGGDVTYEAINGGACFCIEFQRRNQNAQEA
ncbi:ATP-binding protein [Sphingobium nicotianae]|uniref:histidine kinase n=1 Tax=Sphingobium nicotianae TaxID=2782607 RepID=A0A9X1IQQ1_9SPHN|nr:ATP-binding protein [Sphingobium nicotianae]MBT2186794.1 HAMP domain-containing histidine kinase [Sphingobium nicotianae]